jgi:hypothetical protein
VDDDDGLVEIQRQDLQFDAAVIVADPDEAGIGRLRGRHLNRIRRGDHMHRVRLADQVAASGGDHRMAQAMQ